ncbi:MAG: family 43 glycosylhydrolase [Polyangiaceae bacterium]
MSLISCNPSVTSKRCGILSTVVIGVVATTACGSSEGRGDAGDAAPSGGHANVTVPSAHGATQSFGGKDTNGGASSFGEGIGGANAIGGRGVVGGSTGEGGTLVSGGTTAAVGTSNSGGNSGSVTLGGMPTGGKASGGSSMGSGGTASGGSSIGIGGSASGGTSTGKGGSASGGNSMAPVPGFNNPILRHLYTADPAALVHDGTFYVYTGHDEAPANGTAFVMRDWHVFSSKDMAHWRDHGAVLTLGAFKWASANAWAGQVIERNGKFYWYVPVSQRSGGFAIGVAVGNSPIGPFTDARGSALITNAMTTNVNIDWDDIDPSVLVDDDGQAYLYWGNTSCKVVRLASDMINTTGSITYLNLSGFTEAPYINKINGTYYLSYASGMPETIAYATSASPLGPFTRRGTLNGTVPNSPTNHQSLVKFRDRWYFVYHTAALPGGGEFNRSVAIDPLTLNADGTFRQISQSTEGVTQLDPGPFSPDAYHRLTSRADGRVLDVTGSSMNGGATLEQSTWSGLNSQKWRLVPVGSGTYHIVNRQSGHCLEVPNGGLGDGVNLQQAICASATKQYFRLLVTRDGDYAFISVTSGKALGVAANAAAEGARIAQYGYSGAVGQSYRITVVP